MLSWYWECPNCGYTHDSACIMVWWVELLRPVVIESRRRMFEDGREILVDWRPKGKWHMAPRDEPVVSRELEEIFKEELNQAPASDGL